MIEQLNGSGPQVVAQLTITLDSNGQVHVLAKGQLNPFAFYGMMGACQLIMTDKLKNPEKPGLAASVDPRSIPDLRG